MFFYYSKNYKKKIKKIKLCLLDILISLYILNNYKYVLIEFENLIMNQSKKGINFHNTIILPKLKKIQNT